MVMFSMNNMHSCQMNGQEVVNIDIDDNWSIFCGWLSPAYTAH